MAVLRQCLRGQTRADSFRTLAEQVFEDALVGGFGAIEVDLTGDPSDPSSFGRSMVPRSRSIGNGMAARRPAVRASDRLAMGQVTPLSGDSLEGQTQG